jgi:hypothetical protein
MRFFGLIRVLVGSVEDADGFMRALAKAQARRARSAIQMPGSRVNADRRS